MDRINVLYINGTSELGGSEVCLLDIIRRLDKKKLQPFVVLPYYGFLGKELGKLENPPQVIIIKNMSVLKGTYSPFVVGRNLINFIPTVSAIRRLIRDKGIGVVHINSSVILAAGVAAKIERIPIVWHIREIIVSHRLVRTLLNLIIFCLADVILTISDAVKDTFLKQHSNSSKIRTLYDGIDLDIFSDKGPKGKFRQEFNINDKAFLAGMFSRMVPWKGHKYFIKAAKELNDLYPETRFVIVGDIVLKKHLAYKMELIELVKGYGMEEEILFIGNQEDVALIMNDLDCVVLPSISPEPSGRVILEAMAMSKSVIATKRGGPAELIRNEIEGILVAPKDYLSIVKAMMTLKDNPDKSIAIGIKARQAVEERFSLDKQIREIEKIYGSLIN